MFNSLNILFLSFLMLAASLPLDQSFAKRCEDDGKGTWFYAGLGACGEWNSDNDSIVALSAQIYGTGAYCGRWINVTNTENGLTAFGMTHDECESCGPGDLDMSMGLFEQLGELGAGVLPITWEFMPVGWSPP